MRILIFAFVCLPSILFGQDSIPKKAKKHYEEARYFFRVGDAEQAIPFLQKAIKKYPSYRKALTDLSVAYEKTNQFNKAIETYDKLSELYPELTFKVSYQKANIEFNRANYDLAIDHLDHYLKDDQLSMKQKKQGGKFRETAKFAFEAVKNPVPFNPISLGENINTANLEYLPSITADEETIVFTRRSGNSQLDNEDFFISKKKDGLWSVAQNFSKINTQNNEGAQSITADGRAIFFAAKDRKGGYGNFDIWMSYKVGDNWSAPANLGEAINSAYWESQPSISSDGKTLYFLSKRPDGIGGYDIYKSEWKNDKWNAAENLGKTINTPEDEQSPFIHHDNETLYFSSKGHIGMGQADLFFSTKENELWTTAKNLGYPINTNANESSLIVSANGRNAYFASDREGGSGGLDLYNFELPEIIKPKPVTYFKGIVKDANSNKPLSASIQMMNLKNGETVSRTNSDEVNGEFLSTLKADEEYAVNVSKKGYLFHSEHFTFKTNPNGEPYVIEILLKPIIKKQVVNISQPKAEPIIATGSKVVLNNIFFETGKHTLLPASEIELNRLVDLLNDNANLNIRINGHTDNVGTESANQILSEKRAKAVVDYLVLKGINVNRLKYIGYGETLPLTTNDNEKGKAANRRTEFEIIE